MHRDRLYTISSILSATLFHHLLILNNFTHGLIISNHKSSSPIHLMVDQGTTSVLFAPIPYHPVLSSSNTKKLGTEAFSSSGHITTLIAGGKRGTVTAFIPFKTNEHKSLSWAKQPALSLPSEDHNKIGYPIYSMESIEIDKTTTVLACGGGDRYVRLWSYTLPSKKLDDKDPQWSYLASLGPHTGWVKDVVFDPSANVMHSIGCNCIETWGLSHEIQIENSNQAVKFQHLTQRRISSCPNNDSKNSSSSTLSSDLLCLCVYKDINDDSYLYSGGVDGRIHLWPSQDFSASPPLQSVHAHSGRVNCIIASSRLRLMFSSGHDGVVQCRRLSGFDPILPLISEIDVGDRVLAMALIEDNTEENAEFVLGTASGQVIIIEAQILNENSVQLKFKKDWTIEQSVIHDIDVYRPGPDLDKCIAVGHSGGLTIFTH